MELLYKFNTNKVRYSLKYPYLPIHFYPIINLIPIHYLPKTFHVPMSFGSRSKIGSTVISSAGQYINISILII